MPSATGRPSTGLDDEPPRRGRRGRPSFGVALALVAVGAAVLRVTYTVANRSMTVIGDGMHYDEGSRLLADGRGFLNPLVLLWTGVEAQDAKHPPAWTIVLWAGNEVGLRSTYAHQFVAVAVGVATVVMVGLAGRAAFGRRVGLLAAAIVAIYPNTWLYERELVSEPLALLGVATIIWLTYRFLARPGFGLAVALGVVTALTALTRSELILVSVLVVAPAVLGRGQVAWGRRLALLATAAVACIAVITPWFAYNTTRFEEPVPLSAGLGGAMQAGNCAQTYEGDLLGHYVWGCVLLMPASSESTVADAQYRAMALTFMREHASRLPVVVAARLGRAFSVYRPAQQVEFEAERGTATPVIVGGLIGFWILAPFAVAGAVVARRRGVPLYPLVAFLVIVILAVALTIGSVRYRAPAEIPIALLAAVGIDALVRWLGRRRAGPAERRDRAAGAGPRREPADAASRAAVDRGTVAEPAPVASANPHAGVAAGSAGGHSSLAEPPGAADA